MINRRGLRGPVGRERPPSSTGGESPGSLMAPGYGEQAPQASGAIQPFLRDARGPFDLSKDPVNATFRELVRISVEDVKSGIIAVTAQIIPVVGVGVVTRPSWVIQDEIRIVGYLGGNRAILQIGGIGTPAIDPTWNASGAIVYQWSAEDDGESYEQIAVEGRQNTFTAFNDGGVATNDVFVVTRLWRGA